jgi:DNA-directed RNA polymerase subunit M/transcription elongation factor TFIIS
MGVNNMLTFIKESINESDSNIRIIYENGIMAKDLDRYYSDMDRMRGREEATNNLLECPRCHTKPWNTLTFTIQIKRSDEPPSLISKCNDCGNKWRRDSGND